MLPSFLQPALWTYDLTNMDKNKHESIIIFQILNWGTEEMTDWLFKNYSKTKIIEQIKNAKAENWDKKSLNYWQIIFKLQ